MYNNFDTSFYVRTFTYIDRDGNRNFDKHLVKKKAWNSGGTAISGAIDKRLMRRHIWFEIRNDNLADERRLIISESRITDWMALLLTRRSSPRTYVNGGDGRVSNHISDVVYLPSGRSRRRGGRQHHFAACHPAYSPRLDGRNRRHSGYNIDTFEETHQTKTIFLSISFLRNKNFRPLSKIFQRFEVSKFLLEFRAHVLSLSVHSNFSNLLRR